MPGATVRANEGQMRKYLATIFGVAAGITAAVLVAARADEERPDRHATTGRQGGGA